MAIIIGYIIAALGAVITYQFSKTKSKKIKYIVWGFTLMLVISPSLSFSIGLTIAVIVESGWAGMIMWLLFPTGFVIGLIMLLVGVLKKEDVENT